MGLIFNIQRFSIHDGPGIRSTVFFQGCNLRCFWCHNPESQPLEPVVQFFPDKCILCGSCVDVCPQGAQQIVAPGADRATPPPHPPAPALLPFGSAKRGGGGENIKLFWGGEPPQNSKNIDSPSSLEGRKGPGDGGMGQRIYYRDLCTACGTCVQECFARGLMMPAREMSAAEVMAEVLKDRDYYRDSGGGVTFSGGEPFLQKELLLELLALSKQAGLHTAVDTAGNIPYEWLDEARTLTDLFLYDCKVMDEELHQAVTGVSNRRILENLRRLGTSGARVWVRVPVIPGVNDTSLEIGQIGEFLRGLPGVEQVELLPFHHLGAGKYESLGQLYPGKALTPPDAERMAELVQVLTGLGLCAQRMV